MNQEERIVNIKKGKPFRLIPEGVHHEITSVIGSKFSRGTRSILRGLNEYEEKILLPRLLGITPSDPQWYDKVEMFYRNLEIRVPHEGVKLNITTKKRTVLYEGEERQFDYPEVPTDYIKWKQCLCDSSVADTEEEMASGMFKYYIVDEQAVTIKQNKERKEVNLIVKLYGELVDTNEKGEYINLDKMRYLMYMIGYNPAAMDGDGMSAKLDEIKESSIDQIRTVNVSHRETKLYELVNDKLLKPKAKISRLLTLGVLTRSGSYIVDSNNPEKVLGKTLEEAVNFMKDDNNSQIVAMYQHELNKDKELKVE